MANQAVDWDEIRRNAFASDATPAHWPAGVKALSIDGGGLFGINPATWELYWDGSKLATERKLATFERVLAFAATLSAISVAVVDLGRAAGLWG